jgi:siroheme synthase
MTEASTAEQQVLLWQPVARSGGERFSGAVVVEAHVLPAVEPGQFWLVEVPPGEAELAPLEYRALAAANVVIYDRALAPTVARFLPLGGYAEPAPLGDDEDGAALARCVRFIRDGWSVARVMRPAFPFGAGRGSDLRRLSERLLALEMPADLPVSLFVCIGGGAYARSSARLDRLEDGDISAIERRGALTIVFDAVGEAAGPRFSIAPANGLAG